MNGPVLGIFKDFHFESVHQEITPLLILVYPKFKFTTQIRLSTNNLSVVLPEVENIWKKISPDIPFEYEFVDQVFGATYADDQRMRSLFTIFSSIAVVLAVLGLFGLSSFIAKDKLRDISIRKVLGATSLQMMLKLGVGILVLVLIGSVIALPIAFYLVSGWLEAFPYRIDVPVDIFVLSFALIILISIITTSYHALKAALTRPVKILRQS